MLDNYFRGAERLQNKRDMCGAYLYELMCVGGGGERERERQRERDRERERQRERETDRQTDRVDIYLS